jgi:hypothetical protein
MTGTPLLGQICFRLYYVTPSCYFRILKGLSEQDLAMCKFNRFRCSSRSEVSEEYLMGQCISVCPSRLS